MTSAIDKIEALYDLRHEIGGTTREYEPIVRADVCLLAESLDLSTARVCDVGCGEGAHLRALLEVGTRFPVGIDLSGRALDALLNTSDSDRVILIRGDVGRWRWRQYFDAVICSLPPLGKEGGMGLCAFTRTLYTLLRHRGVLLLKLFTLESAPSIVGSYAVQYEGAKAICSSDVRLSENGRTLFIEQHAGDRSKDKWVEQLALYSRDEVLLALDNIGFKIVKVIDQTSLSLTGTETFLARA